MLGWEGETLLGWLAGQQRKELKGKGQERALRGTGTGEGIEDVERGGHMHELFAR